MKGLLQKDLYMIWKYCRMLLLICAAFLIGGVGAGIDNAFFIIYPVLLASVMPVTLMSYDERFGWNKTCDTMPISRKTVVHARYVMALRCFAALYALTLLVQAAVLLPQGQGEELLDMATSLPIVGLLSPTVLLPVIFKWGVEKGRIAYYILIGAMTAAGMVFMSDMNMGAPDFPLRGGAALLFILSGCRLRFLASWLLSVKIYEKREL